MSIRLTLEGITPDAYQALAEGDWDGYQQTRIDEQIDKNWVGLQILLCNPRPDILDLAGLALQGGIPVENPAEEDYGGAFVLPPRIVKMIAAEFAQIDDEDISYRCAHTRWEGTYYGGVPAEDIERSMLYAFRCLREFFAACAEAGDGVLRRLG